MCRMTQPDFLSSVISRLRAVKHSELPELARVSQVPESTIRKIRHGEVRNPRVQTVQMLHDYFVSLDEAELAPPQQAQEVA